MKFNAILNLLSAHPFLIGLTIRITLMVLFPLLLDDGILLQGVKYTDIDYDVFTDAARYVSDGRSPFDRHTYRYTPFLALILSYTSEEVWWRKERYFGRMLFCVADTLCGLVILQLRRKARKNNAAASSPSSSDNYVELQDALWWMYNPLPINICTRGSAESFVVLLSVLASVSIVTIKQKSQGIFLLQALVSGAIHGLAIHAKLYPIIYTASYMAYFAHEGERRYLKVGSDKLKVIAWKNEMKPSDAKKDAEKENERFPFPWLQPKRFLQLIKLWVFRVMTPTPIVFFLSSMFMFGMLTFLAVHYYGPIAMEEGLLYHFSRVDHRHNYSMFWYWIYLARARVVALGAEVASSSLPTMGRALLLPQIVLLLFSSLGIAPYDLSFALFVQTFFFVALNKVITAQYFTWYLVLLPLCSDRIKWNSGEMVFALGMLGVSILTWLGSAFCLEMKGMAVHLQVWLSSLIFFVANVNLLRVILKSYDGFEPLKVQFKEKLQ